MAKGVTRTFHPPTADQVAGYLDQHTIANPSRLSHWMPAIIVGVLVLLALSWSNMGMTFIVWLALLGLFINAMLRARLQRNMDQQLVKAQELTLQRQNAEALRVAWQLIPQLRTRPQQYTRAIALLAHNLEQVRAYDAAVIAFGRVLQHLPEDHPATTQMRVEQTMAMLASDQLTDADNHLRRLRNTIDRHTNTAIQAGFHLAALYQQVRTNHFRDAADNQQGMLEKLRPLGIDAGFGHALLALACYHSAVDEQDSLIAQSQLWWDRATLLLPVATLVKRFPELHAIEQGPTTAARINKPASPVVETPMDPPIENQGGES